MSEKLPKGWAKTTLGEIAELARARVSPAEVPDLPYIGLEHIQSQAMKLIGHRHALEIRSSALRFSKGDVLYGKMRPYLNKVWVAEFDGICSAEFLVFSKCVGLDSRFLAARLNAKDFVAFASRKVSGERPRVDFEKLSCFPVLLPPISEQRRIVARLHTALSRVERAETAARRAQERLKRYRVAVFNAAATGELTRDWRKARQHLQKAGSETGEALLRRVLQARREEWTGEGEYKEPAQPIAGILPKPPEGWITASLEQLTSANRVICYGILMPKEHVPEGIPYVKVRDIRGDKIDFASLPRTSPEIAAKYSRASLKSGDILLAIRGTYGRVAEVPPELDGGNITQDTARLAFTELVDRRYVASFLRSEHAQGYFNRVARGVAVKGVNISDVRLCPILLPPLNEQVRVVEEVEHRLVAADRLTTNLEQQMARARAARESLACEAFGGRLVSQIPDEEPASTLIERIRADREALAQKPRSNRMPKSRPRLRSPRRSLLDVLREHATPITPEQLFREAGFEASQVDLLYRELSSIRDKLREEKPQASEATSWPHRARVLLHLKEDAEI